MKPRSRRLLDAALRAASLGAAISLSSCRSDGGGALGETLDPDADKRITQRDQIAVVVVAVPGTDTGTLDLTRLAGTIRREIDRRKAAAPTPRPPRRFALSVTISRYDGGSAQGAPGSGQTHIDGWRLLTDPDIVARLHGYRDRVADRDDFAWGRLYPAPTPIQTVEGDFAAAVAADLFAAR